MIDLAQGGVLDLAHGGVLDLAQGGVLDLPYRGAFGEPRPEALSAIPLPPAPMPSRHRLRPLKSWRYVAVLCPQIMLCAASVRIGRARQAFWALWNHQACRFYEHTTIGRGTVRLPPGRLRVLDRQVQIDLELDEQPGIETVCPSGWSYAWTRKQGGVRAQGTVMIDGQPQPLHAHAVIDDTAAYYERHTSWSWSAGVGRTEDGRAVAWNLVDGVNDPPQHSERTVWIDGDAREVPPVRFAPDLSAVDSLHFHEERAREHRQNLLLIRSSYRQPFGTFSGSLPNGGPQLAEGYGVMEDHNVTW